MPERDYQSVLDFLSLLDIPEDEALKAMLSAFGPANPGALRGSWKQRKNYGTPPSTQEIWKLFKDSDFRCSKCKSYLRITLDHANKNAKDDTLDNYKVLCFACNRASGKGTFKSRHPNVRIYCAAMKLYQLLGRWPKDKEIRNEAQVDDLSGATYLVRFLEHVLQKEERST